MSVGYHDGTAFADRLDRAIEASDRAKLIEARVTGMSRLWISCGFSAISATENNGFALAVDIVT